MDSHKYVLELSTKQIKNKIKAILSDGTEKSPPVRQDQSSFTLDEEFIKKKMKENCPQFFSHVTSDEYASYFETLCEFSQLIARETASKINNSIGLMLRATCEGSGDGPEAVKEVIAVIGNITDCLLSSSTNKRQEEIQDLHEEEEHISHVKKSEETVKSDHGNCEEECSENLNSGAESSVEDSDEKQCDEGYQDPQEQMEEEFRVLSHHFSEEILNIDDEDSADESSDDEDSADESSDDEDSADESSESSDDEDSADDCGKCDTKEETSLQPRQAPEVRPPSEPRRLPEPEVRPPSEPRRLPEPEVRPPSEPRKLPEPNSAHRKISSVVRGLVMYTIKKSKTPPSMIDGRSLINNLTEKAKQKIKPNKNMDTTLENVEEIHKAVFKGLLKKVGTAREILQIMETQCCDSVFIDELRIQLMSPPVKKKEPFHRFFSSMGKLLKRPFRT